MDTNMASHPGRLLSSDRVLLHLLEHPLQDQTFEVGMELTQSGISDATMVQRKHLSRVLNPMIDQGWVNRTERRVSSSKQRRWVYSLTVEGIRYAQEMRDELLRATVTVDGSMVPFGDLVASQPLLDVAMHIDETGTWSDSIGVQSSSVRPNIARADAEDLIRRVFERAWFDGILTPDEQALVDEVVDFLHIDEGSIRRISETARKKARPGETAEDVYRDVLSAALDDRAIDDGEDRMLTALRSAVGIDAATHRRLVEELIGKPLESEEIYLSALGASLDGGISSDQAIVLDALRRHLRIALSRHEELVKQATDRFN